MVNLGQSFCEKFWYGKLKLDLAAIFVCTQIRFENLITFTYLPGKNNNIQNILQIGMSHDFEHPPSSECNHQGLMSYNKIKETWSTCSVKDFKTWWRKTGFGCKEIKSYHSKFFFQNVICLMILL